jgi:hypothetical protein
MVILPARSAARDVPAHLYHARQLPVLLHPAPGHERPGRRRAGGHTMTPARPELAATRRVGPRGQALTTGAAASSQFPDSVVARRGVAHDWAGHGEMGGERAWPGYTRTGDWRSAGSTALTYMTGEIPALLPSRRGRRPPTSSSASAWATLQAGQGVRRPAARSDRPVTGQPDPRGTGGWAQHHGQAGQPQAHARVPPAGTPRFHQSWGRSGREQTWILRRPTHPGPTQDHGRRGMRGRVVGVHHRAGSTLPSQRKDRNGARR